MECIDHQTPARHINDIGMAVEFVRNRVKKFDNLPDKVVPKFRISEEEINYLENCMRRTISQNCGAAGVDMDEGFEAFFEDAVRFGLNCMLEDENHPAMKRYLKEMRDKKHD